MVFVILLLISAILACPIRPANAHGMLLNPAQRSSLWRFPEFQAYNVPPNYSDNQLYCGGKTVMYEQNGGNCGVCGDNWAQPRPRDNESGGMYGQGVIAANYTSGQVIPILVDITANHSGTFQFTLCPRNDQTLEQEECFKYTLPFADGTGFSKTVTEEEYRAGFVNTELTLPPGVSCSYCILRWHYRTGNSWGVCEDGTSALGCGDQEVFRNCADISIAPTS